MDTLRSPQARTTFLASASFLILMVQSIRDAPGLGSLWVYAKQKAEELITTNYFFRIQTLTKSELHVLSPSLQSSPNSLLFIQERGIL